MRPSIRDQNGKSFVCATRSPSATHAITVNEDGELAIWETISGAALNSVAQRIDAPSVCYPNNLGTWSKDGAWLVHNLAQGVGVWETAKRTWVPLPDSGNILLGQVSFGPGGAGLVALAVEGNQVEVWNLRTKMLLKRFEDANIAQWDPSGARIAVGGVHASGTDVHQYMTAWRVKGMVQLWGRKDSCLGDWSHDGGLITVIDNCMWGGITRVLAAPTGHVIATVGGGLNGQSGAWHPTAPRFLHMSQSGARVWDRARGSIEIARADSLDQCEGGCGQNISWSDDGSMIATNARAWVEAGGSYRRVALQHPVGGDQAYSFFGPGASRLTCADRDGAYWVHAVPDGKLVAGLHFEQRVEGEDSFGADLGTHLYSNALAFVVPWSTAILELARVSDGERVMLSVVVVGGEPKKVAFTRSGAFDGDIDALRLLIAQHPPLSTITADAKLERPTLLEDFMSGKNISQ